MEGELHMVRRSHLHPVMSSDGRECLSYGLQKSMDGERMEISMKIDGEHVNHDNVKATQNGEVVLDDHWST